MFHHGPQLIDSSFRDTLILSVLRRMPQRPTLVTALWQQGELCRLYRPRLGRPWTILVFGWRSASSAGGLAQAFAAGFTSKGALPLSLLVLERQGGAVHPNGLLSAGPSRAVPFFELSIGTRFPPYLDAGNVMTKAAPRPLFRTFDQPSLHR